MDYQDLIQKFLNEYDFMYDPGKRDNCGLAASDMMIWIDNNYGIKTKRIRGWFYCNEFVYSKKDFTPEMKYKLIKDGYVWDSSSSRKKWLLDNGYSEDYKFVPHYWLEDKQKNIIDPSGDLQFIKTGLVSNLNNDRYNLSKNEFTKGNSYRPF